MHPKRPQPEPVRSATPYRANRDFEREFEALLRRASEHMKSKKFRVVAGTATRKSASAA